MIRNKLLKSFVCILAFSFISFQLFAMTPNPLISRGKQVYTNNSEFRALVDGKFGGSTWIVAAGNWAAINIGEMPDIVFLTWNATNYIWSDIIASTSCPQNIAFPTLYEFHLSSNSTNGSDGDWSVVKSISGNLVAARGHRIRPGDATWIKMNIIEGGGRIDEIEVFDISNGNDDTWFFAGTSITSNAFKGPVPEKNFSDLITEKHPSFTPAIIRGAIPCISSSDMADDISRYMQFAGNVRYWAIEMGTNDAWGGSSANAQRFRNNLQLIIDSCKARGIEPIIANTISTDFSKANWQIHPDYLSTVKDLTLQNQLITGPDLYEWFIQNPDGLDSDGVHPNRTGGSYIQNLWAQTAEQVYATNSTKERQNKPKHLFIKGSLHLNAKYGNVALRSQNPGIVSIFNIQGKLLTQISLYPEVPKIIETAPGFYISKFITSQGVEYKPITVQ